MAGSTKIVLLSSSPAAVEFLLHLEVDVVSVDALPLKLEYCYTQPAVGDDAMWIERRFRDACRQRGSAVTSDGARLRVTS